MDEAMDQIQSECLFHMFFLLYEMLSNEDSNHKDKHLGQLKFVGDEGLILEWLCSKIS